MTAAPGLSPDRSTAPRVRAGLMEIEPVEVNPWEAMPSPESVEPIGGFVSG